MIELMVAEVCIKALALVGILYLVARHEADFSFQTVAMVTAGLMAASVVLDALLTPYIGLFTAVPIVLLVVMAVHRFCWVPWQKAILVALLFGLFNALVALGAAQVQRRIHRTIDGTLGAATRSHEKDLKEARAFMQHVYGAGGLLSHVPTGSQAVAAVRGAATSATSKLTNTAAHMMAPAATNAASVAVTAEVAAVSVSPPGPPLDWEGAERRLIVRGTFKGSGGTQLAQVNQEQVEEGQIVSVTLSNYVYRLKAAAITRMGVTWDPVDARPAK